MNNIKYKYYYITDKNGNSNCVIRSLCKLLNKEYEEVYNVLLTISNKLNMNTNDIEVFEQYMLDNNIINIGYKGDKLIKEFDFENEKYIVFCYDKKDYYHMVPIINNVMYDRTEDSLNLYIISIYKKIK